MTIVPMVGTMIIDVIALCDKDQDGIFLPICSHRTSLRWRYFVMGEGPVTCRRTALGAMVIYHRTTVLSSYPAHMSCALVLDLLLNCSVLTE